jgi:cytochrome c biogenesis protein CcdA
MIAGLLLFGMIFGSGVSPATSNTISVSDFYFCLGRSNIYFVVTFGTEEYLKAMGLWEEVKPKLSTSQAFVIAANTHIGNIKDLDLENKVFLIDENGFEYPHIGRAMALTAHHNTYLVFFPRYDMMGAPLFEREQGKFDIVIRNIDFDERVFTFYHPLPTSRQGRLTPPNITTMIMLITAALAGLTLACSPCLLGALTVGSLTLGTTSSGPESTVGKRLKSMLVKNTVSFLLTFIVAYMLMVIATAAFNVGPEAFRTVEIIGGALLLVFGLSFLRVWGPVKRLENTLANFLIKLRPGFRKYVTNEDLHSVNVDPKVASTMGTCLSFVCSTAGAPTLSMSLVLPLMVYAGLGNLYWSFMIVLAYLIAASIPFLLLALGLGELLLKHAAKMANRLLVLDAFLLVGLGVILLFSPGVILNALFGVIYLLFYRG